MVDLQTKNGSLPMKRDLVFEDNDFVKIKEDKENFNQQIDLTTNTVRGSLRYNINSGMNNSIILDDKRNVVDATKIDSYFLDSYKDVDGYSDVEINNYDFNEKTGVLIINYTTISFFGNTSNQELEIITK